MWKFISRMNSAVALVSGLPMGFGSAGVDDWPQLGRDGSRYAVIVERPSPPSGLLRRSAD